MANSLVELVPAGRTVVFLEGGYDVNAIRASVSATFSGLAGVIDPGAAPHGESEPAAWRALELAEKAAGEFWEVR